MRVLLTGPAWFGDLLPACERGWRELGAEVQVFATTQSEWGARADRWNRVLQRLPVRASALSWRLMRVALDRHRQEVEQRFRREVERFRPDLLLSILCWGESLSFDTVSGLRGLRRAAWLMDDPFLRNGELAALVGAYDHAFVIDQSWRAPIHLLTGRPVDMLTCGADFELYRPVAEADVPPALRSAVVFVGTSYHGEAAGAVRRQLLHAVADLGLHLYGDAGWRADSTLGRCYQGRALRSAEVNLAYNGADVVLNVHHPQFRQGTSLRTFAIAASRRFQLCDWRPGIEEFFVPDEEIVCYRNADELREKTRMYLRDPERRGRIALAGYERVRREHGYADRLRRMQALLSSGNARPIDANVSVGGL